MEKPAHSRRNFLGSIGATLAALSLSPSLAAADYDQAAAKALPRKKITDPYIYKFTIGKFEAWSISDGYGTFKNCVTKKMFPKSDTEAMTKALVASGERPDDVTLYINILLLRKDKEIILVDAGFGPVERDTWGWLIQAMASPEINIKPEQVTHALLSHSHIDHIGGFTTKGHILYPNAAVHVLQTEIDFWRARNRISLSPTAPTTSKA